MSSFNHLLRKPHFQKEKYLIEKRDGVNLVWVKTTPYILANSKTRVFNWFYFSYLISKIDKVCKHKPDAILYSSPSLVGYLGARVLSKRYSATLTFEVRDIWPKTLCQIGSFSSLHPFIRFLQWIEDYAYKTSTNVVSNLPNALFHMEKRGLNKEKFTWIPNGYSKYDFFSGKNISSEVLSLLPKDKFIVGYTGTLGKANAINYLIEAACYLKEEKDIFFVIVGDGSDKVDLVNSAKIKGLKNIIFIDPISKLEVASMLSHFDLCYLGWHNNEIYDFGIAANKLCEYFLSSKPVLHSYSGNSDPVLTFNSGISVEAENPLSIAEGIKLIRNMTEEQRFKLGRNGYDAAFIDFEYEHLAQRLLTIIFNNG